MAGEGKAPLPRHTNSESSGKATVEHVFKVNSLGEIEDLVKSAIWMGYCIPGRLVAIHFDRKLPKESTYKVKWKFETSQSINPQDFERKFVVNLSMKAGECKSASSVPLYTNKDTSVKMEVLTARLGVLATPVVIKTYHCGFCNINDFIREALLQVRLTSDYTCQLLDFSICKGSEQLFEVRLIMERLEEDLEADIKRRESQKITYTEAELKRILECMAEALMFGKLRVRSTIGSGAQRH